MRKYRKLLRIGKKAQRKKLKENKHKKDWEDMSFDEIASLLYEESEEVHEEITTRKPDYQSIKYECADLANACHMMIMYCERAK